MTSIPLVLDNKMLHWILSFIEMKTDIQIIYRLLFTSIYAFTLSCRQLPANYRVYHSYDL